MAVDVKPDPQTLGENPLIEGLERLPVPATTLTIFGVTGDLAHRKLLPALYNLAHEGALPERFNLVGVSRRDMPDDDFRAMAKGAIEKFSRREPDATVLEGLLARMHYVGFSFDDVPSYARLRETLDAARLRGRRQAQPRLLPLDGAGVLPGDRQGAARGRPQLRPRRRRPLHHREAVRHRPRVRARAPARRRARLPRAAGLPDRSLPGQGDRPERDGVPVRELHVRAGLEPQLHRAHPDHRGRGHRDRLAGGLLRPVGRAARPRPEPHAAAADARLHGAAGELRGRQGPRREGQGAAVDHAADARGGPARHRARAVHGRRRGRRGRRRLPRGGRRPRQLAHRDLRRAAARGPQLALGGRADLPAHRQAARAQGDRDRRPAQARPAPGVPVARLGRRAAQPARADDAAQRGRVAVAGREDPRLEHAHPAREHGVPVRLGVHVAVARRPTSG